ncbi:MAG: hypothetical protein AVDCRST_MAG91-3229 [uncultured Sphingomonadaceae bacterium]|uniref:Uncharacterized protein n=1 Tax=uncultured Sphingomonadaceae bacterium TaxID=169976 RepID=A0A6J4TXH2_9SPHN|nr:MAG: hypothetical protein AVDCRST_MAG91-3229 [uncultured Sphingomonadaceae bacterium]
MEQRCQELAAIAPQMSAAGAEILRARFFNQPLVPIGTTR